MIGSIYRSIKAIRKAGGFKLRKTSYAQFKHTIKIKGLRKTLKDKDIKVLYWIAFKILKIKK